MCRAFVRNEVVWAILPGETKVVECVVMYPSYEDQPTVYVERLFDVEWEGNIDKHNVAVSKK